MRGVIANHNYWEPLMDILEEKEDGGIERLGEARIENATHSDSG